jgi:hypothetical protein
MRRHELDYILSKMLEYEHEVSDLNFTVDKPLQVESFGELGAGRCRSADRTLDPVPN